MIPQENRREIEQRSQRIGIIERKNGILLVHKSFLIIPVGYHQLLISSLEITQHLSVARWTKQHLSREDLTCNLRAAGDIRYWRDLNWIETHARTLQDLKDLTNDLYFQRASYTQATTKRALDRSDNENPEIKANER